MLDAAGAVEQYIFCSSAGVYKKSDEMPHREEDAVDFNSRHKVRRSLPAGCWLLAACGGSVGGGSRQQGCMHAAAT